MIPTFTPFCPERRPGLREVVLPKVTKKMQRKNSFFVQQVQPFPFQGNGCSRLEKVQSCRGKPWPPGRCAGSQASLWDSEQGFRARHPDSGASVCQEGVERSSSGGGQWAASLPSAPPVAPGGAASGVDRLSPNCIRTPLP